MVITEKPTFKIVMDKDIAALIWDIGKATEEAVRPAIAKRVKIERDRETTLLAVTDTHRLVLYRDAQMNEIAEGVYYLNTPPEKKNRYEKFLSLQPVEDEWAFPNWKRVCEGLDEQEKIGSLMYIEHFGRNTFALKRNTFALKIDTPLYINMKNLPELQTIPLDIYAKRRKDYDTYRLVDRTGKVPIFEMLIAGISKR